MIFASITAFPRTQTFFARYSHRYTEDVPLKAFPEEITIAEGRVIQENRARNFVAEYTHTLVADDGADRAPRVCAHALRLLEPGAGL